MTPEDFLPSGEPAGALPQGTAAQAAARVREPWAANADSVVLRPFGQDPVGQVTATLVRCAGGDHVKHAAVMMDELDPSKRRRASRGA